jgi:aspartokinase-like uncharacterized kinase
MKKDSRLPKQSDKAADISEHVASLELSGGQDAASGRMQAGDSLAITSTAPQSFTRNRAEASRADRAIRVLKYGGSLLTQPDRWRDLQRWRQQQADAYDVLVVGGGVAVDQLRAWNDLYDFPADQMHQLAIELMGFNARWLRLQLPGWGYWSIPAASSRPASELRLAARALMQQTNAGAIIVDPTQWLHHDRELPRDWTVTSDSIAAYLAQLLGADELVLFKSTLPAIEEAQSRDAMVRGSGVDLAFRHFSNQVPNLRWVDFTQSDWPQIQFGPMTLERLGD